MITSIFKFCGTVIKSCYIIVKTTCQCISYTYDFVKMAVVDLPKYKQYVATASAIYMLYIKDFKL